MHQRALARTGGTKNRQRLAHAHVKGYSVERMSVFRMTEVEIAHHDAAAQWLFGQPGRNRWLRLDCDGLDFPNPRNRYRGFAKVSQDAAHLTHRPEHNRKVRQKGEKLSHTHVTRRDPMRAHKEGQAKLSERDEIAD